MPRAKNGPRVPVRAILGDVRCFISSRQDGQGAKTAKEEGIIEEGTMDKGTMDRPA
jgi:hypothetical protein